MRRAEPLADLPADLPADPVVPVGRVAPGHGWDHDDFEQDDSDFEQDDSDIDEVG